ncbi:uncharacterized protein LOC122274630 [Carya illinoinensis]|uniref:uncharacterized protein LOC122274630 n=1 Tax=Carya illinoinensis TaxID=32201 RepID=UPI001C71862C|nr:uncharacterized protein LOC122274630 [Carya illinoinensis]
MWKRLWSMKVAPAVKHFVWRACKEALPTLANLKIRKVVEESLCPICNLEPETSGHALWGCVAARDVWNQRSVKTQKMSFQHDLILKVWSKLNQKPNTYELEECVVTMRGIWSRRNESMHGKGFKHPNTVVRGAKADILNYKDANSSKKEHKQPTHQATWTWRKPTRGTYKVNWDAALNIEAGKMGLGVLVRDYKGHVIGALRARRPLAGKALEAEAYGSVLAATFCKELGLKQLHLEGDSQLVINLLKGVERN